MFLITLKGVITGLILSLPFGPVGIYCMEKTMIEGHKRGYVSALGMVTVDIIYALTALLFMSYVEDLIMRYESLLQILVAIFLIFVGWKKLEKRVKIKKIECTPTGIVKDYFTTFFIALANLSGIFTILVIFTTLKVYSEETFLVAPFIALGIFLGGSIEWFTTTYVIANFTKVLDERKLIKISQLSGGIIFLFGVLILAKNTLKIL
ncbi:homoserine/Threonine efflux protein [Fusobacterium necrogenes]|uniref:Homoserine/Threonine efflux protein n=1 Tax=Fusobacterium necrogenes TaxID=858 RepID=A0A377GXQ8_9FUSO|nr:LysE family transporter [Fusobacterium necrogenes]STO31552.1 homoserine/Threonine efflux protein [Fusobacterium necrogenes]